ncbi:MAG TPA: hypothetical protein VFH68_05295 [Polyangia bacterium]|nr:hypothetical protein [Polyangia bacterium]
MTLDKSLRSLRNRSLAAGAALAGALLAADCTIVVPPPPKEKPPVVIIDPGKQPPKPKPVEAHALFVMNLHQSSANLAQYYVTIADALIAGLATRGVNVARWAVVPTYPGAEGMKLLFGAQTPTDPPTLPPIPGFGGAGGGRAMDGFGGTSGGPPIPPIPAPAFDTTSPTPPPDLPAIPTLPNGTDIVTALQQLAATGKYDGIGTTNEAEGVIRTGNHLVEAHLPPDLGGLDGAAFFDRPRNLFMVIYLQPLARKCGMSSASCAVDGRSPGDIFTETKPDGTAAWLHFATGGIPLGQVVHVAIDTKEGEPADVFRKRCTMINGFPTNLLDVMEPSPALYFDPLTAALNAAHPGTGQSGDLCSLLGELGLTDPAQRTSVNRLINSIASMAGSAPDTTTDTTTPPPSGLP